MRNDSCRADQLACDCIAVEPVLELPVIARSRSMQCRDGPGYCSAGHCADICTLYCHDDEICVNNNLTVRDANACIEDGTVPPIVWRCTSPATATLTDM